MALQVRIKDPTPLELTQLRGLDLDAQTVQQVLDALAARSGLITGLDLSGTTVAGSVSMVKLNVSGRVRAANARFGALRLAAVDAHELDLTQIVASTGSLVFGELRVTGRCRIVEAAAHRALTMRGVHAGDLSVERLNVGEDIAFERVSSASGVRIVGCKGAHSAVFEGVHAAGSIVVGDLDVVGSARFIDAEAAELAIAGVSAERVSLESTTVQGEWQVRDIAADRVGIVGAHGDRVRLTDCEVAACSVADVDAQVVRIGDIRGDQLDVARVTATELTLDELTLSTSIALRAARSTSMRIDAVTSAAVVVEQVTGQSFDARSVSCAESLSLADVEFGRVVVSDLWSGQTATVIGGSWEACRTTFAAPAVTLHGLRAGTGRIDVYSDELACRECSFQDKVRLSSVDVWAVARCDVVRRESVGGAIKDAPTKLMSLERCDVAGLELSRFDLTACRFRGTAGLAQATISTECQWEARRAGLLAGRRLMLAEEAVSLNQTGDDNLTAAELTDLYRGVRASIERGGDERRAGDLYYGEMQMRRRIASTVRERLTLNGYWALSGYGQRPWRPMATLAALVALGLVVLALIPVAATSSDRHQLDIRSLGTVASAPVSSYRIRVTPVEHHRRPSTSSLLMAELLAVGRLSPPEEVTESLGNGGKLVLDLLGVAGPLLIVLALVSVRRRTQR